MIEPYMEDLERRIDPEVEEALWAAWAAFADGEFEGDLFSPVRAHKAPPGLDWPDIPMNDSLEDYELMALRMLRKCSRMLAEGTGEILAVRCNYGTGILPTVFGAELFVMDAETNTLPTSVPLGGVAAMNLDDSLKPADATEAAKAIQAILERGVPDLRAGLGGKVFEMAAYYQDLFRAYPKVQRYVHIYHPDVQGPMDVCELLWGSALFMALVEAPDLVTRLLALVTETYVQFMRAWAELVPFDDEYAVHWHMLHKGNIMLRDDSAMNLSPRMFDRFIKPYDGRLLREFGGGGLHFCGRGDHYIESASEIEGLTTINMSQPSYNDMERIFAHTVDKGINIIGLPRAAAEAAVAQGRDLHGRVHCLT
jgi:hypothetical protein